jgi:FixJ family two-component response regulator
LDLLVELRRRKVDLLAILITTHPNTAVHDRAARAGVPLIEKPLLNDLLFQGIRITISQRPRLGKQAFLSLASLIASQLDSPYPR